MQGKSRLAIAVAALVLAGTQACAGTVEDAAITAKVKSALIADPVAKAYQIDVDTKDGLVQLNGFVDSTAGKTVAGRVANNVEGVKGVDNNLDVQTQQRGPGEVIDDAVVTAKVKSALIEDPSTKASQIDVDTREGTVQLDGYVSSESAKDRAAKLARAVKGVRDVENNLTVKL